MRSRLLPDTTMTTQHLPILSVVPAPFDKFIIEDEKGRRWNGKDLKANEKTPATFMSQFDVRSEMHEILKGHYPNVQPVRYVVPVFVDVYSYSPVEISEVGPYLAQAGSLQMNTPDCGYGPNNSLILPRIEWHLIEQLKAKP